MDIDRGQMIRRLILRGLLIMLFSMVVAGVVVAWLFADLPPADFRRAVMAGILIPALISPPVSLIVGRLNYNYYLLHRKAKWMAAHDELTDLLNRRAFREEAEQMLARHGRACASKPLIMLLADIDHFKAVNDSFGHDAGDRAIQHVARILEDLSPAAAVVARIGGEEFAILAEMDSLSNARARAELICRKVKTAPFLHQGHPVPLTLSLGVAVAQPQDEITNLFQRADRELYKAKDQGRDAYSIAASLVA